MPKEEGVYRKVQRGEEAGGEEVEKVWRARGQYDQENRQFISNTISLRQVPTQPYQYKRTSKKGSVSNRPRAAVVPRKGLRWIKGKGKLPLVNREDKQELDKSPPSILYLFIQEIYQVSHATRYSNINRISHVYLVTCVKHPSVVYLCHVLDRTIPMSSY